MQNDTGQTLALTLLVALFVIALSAVPQGWALGDFTLRKMDILSDIRTEKPAAPAPDTPVAAVPPPAPDSFPEGPIEGILPAIDSVYYGKIIEDYSADQHAMARFFAAVDSIRSGRQAVRIAFFGDSFVEGDILLGDLRDTLQSLWGGNGVGFVPITSEVARFKRSLQHVYENWNIYSIVKKTAEHPDYGISGFAWTPFPGASVQYKGASWFRHTRSWSKLRLFYGGDSLGAVYYQINDRPAEFHQFAPPDGKVGALELRFNRMYSVGMQFPEPGGLVLYGASLEDGPGIYIDNFSVRGNSGGRLKQISCPMMHAFDRYQHYKLIVLQVGLNAATNDLHNINWYRQELDETFAHLKKCFPDKPILVIGIPDRAGKIDGALRTLPSVPVIVEMQRELARKHGLLFYDLMRGMGGPGAMVHYANQKPALANKDFTHLTHEGGRHVSHLFTRILLEEQAYYRSRKPAGANDR